MGWLVISLMAILLGSCGTPRKSGPESQESKTSAMFYWTWHEGDICSYKNIVNISDVIRNHPEALDFVYCDKAHSEQPTDNSACRLVGIDHFGRSFSTVDSLRTDRKVGLFYWPWIGQPYASDIYDATRIRAMEDGLKILTDMSVDRPDISPNGQAHFWGKPLWGYYNSIDEWVIRKQMQMITLAGVDFIFFDHTNSLIYPEVTLKVCKVIQDMLDEGWNAPRIVSYTHSKSFQTVRSLWKTIYGPGKYPDTWFRIDGKPVVVAYTDAADDLREAASRNDRDYTPGELSQEIRDFFYFFKPNWPSDPTFDDGFPWIEWKFPQPLHSGSGVMNVTVASHPMVPMSFSWTRENWTNWGRGWDPDLKQNVAEDVEKGTYFQKQWDEVIKADPKIVSVGGWNEWVAYKQPWDGEYMLCDSADEEYSRDIEPMEGGYQDAFYLQLIANIRRYKGARGAVPSAEPSVRKGFDEMDLSQWDKVSYVVRHPDSKQQARDCFGASKTVRYTQDAPENPLKEVRVAHDRKNLYFLITGFRDFTAPAKGESNWLNLFIGAGEPQDKGWESYEYLIGAICDGTSASIETLSPDFDRKHAGNAGMALHKDRIILRIPRSMIGLKAAGSFHFKVTTGVENPSNIMDTYKSGSAMPMGRLSFLYRIS